MGKYVIVIMSLSFFLMFGCVSKSKYTELESNLMDTQTQVNKGDRTIESLEQRLQQSNETIGQLEQKLENSQEENTICKKNLTDTETKLSDLLEKNNSLEDELTESRAVIEDQKTKLVETNQAKKSLEMTLKDQILSQQIKINEIEGKLKVTFIDKILFNSGSARINEKGMELLDRMAASLKELEDQNIAVEGHTDNVPIGALLKERYPTNWDLSTARAVAVVRHLTEEDQMNPGLFSAIGYGDNRPVDTNDTEEGRSQNRRIEIILIPIK